MVLVTTILRSYLSSDLPLRVLVVSALKPLVERRRPRLCRSESGNQLSPEEHVPFFDLQQHLHEDATVDVQLAFSGFQHADVQGIEAHA